MVVPDIGESDVFEAAYMAELKALLTRHGLVLNYEHDRAAIDTGLHLFLEGEGARQASQVRVWFQAKGKRPTHSRWRRTRLARPWRS